MNIFAKIKICMYDTVIKHKAEIVGLLGAVITIATPAPEMLANIEWLLKILACIGGIVLVFYSVQTKRLDKETAKIEKHNAELDKQIKEIDLKIKLSNI